MSADPGRHVPAPRTVQFDPEALFTAVDRRRRELRISAREVLRQIGEHTPSSLTRMGRGAHPSADLLCRLLVWLGDTDLRPYLAEVPGARPDQPRTDNPTRETS